MSRVLVALNAPERNADFLYYAKFIAICLANDPIFADPNPPLAVYEAHIADLEAAQAHTLTRMRGAADARNARKAVVHGDLRHVQNFVQGLADATHDGAMVIARSGMSVKMSSGHGKPDFEAKLGKVSGSVHLFARAANTRASYDWAYSLDGVTWILRPSTVRADTVIPNLAPRTRYFFRHRCVTKDGVGDWSQVVSILVF
jgi:hypothetical protein